MESRIGGGVAGERGEPEATTYHGVVAPAVSPASDSCALDTTRKATLADSVPTDVTPHHGILAKIVQQLRTQLYDRSIKRLFLLFDKATA